MILKKLTINVLLLLYCFTINKANSLQTSFKIAEAKIVKARQNEEDTFKVKKAITIKKNNKKYFIINTKNKEFLLSDKGYFYNVSLGKLKKLKLELYMDSEEDDTIEKIVYHEYKDNIILYCHGDSNAQPIMFITSVNFLKNKRNWCIDVYNTISSTVYFIPPNIGKVLVGRFNKRFNLDNGKIIE